MTQKIKMIVPVPVPPEALANFAAQVPQSLKRPEYHFEFVAVKSGGTTGDSYFETTLMDAFVLDAGMRAEQEGYAAVCINTVSDSGLNALRSRLTIPVVGSGQTAFHTACLLGKRFSILAMWDEWFPMYEKILTEQKIADRCASMRSINTRPDTAELLAGKEDIVFAKLEEAALAAIEQDGADVIVLGSTTMHQSHAYLASRLPVPVVNPGLVAYKFCEMLLDLAMAHSKIAYKSPGVINDGVLDAVPWRFPPT